MKTYDKLNEQLAPWPPIRVLAYGSSSIAMCYFCPPLCHQISRKSQTTVTHQACRGEQASGKV